MTGFSYRDGRLHAEGVDLGSIAEAVGTPVYVYSTERLVANYRAYASAFEGQDVRVCFALKANSSLAVVRTFAELGSGADVVSEGELRRALAAGVPAERIVFSGVGKTREELRAALTAGIHQINVESLPEMRALSEVAAGLGVTAPVAIRVNPDVDARTHEKIATGKKENKFGIDWEHARAAFAEAAALPGLAPVAIAVHIGSQLTDLAPFRDAYTRVADLLHALRADGHDIRRLDLGGGLGIRYHEEEPPDLPAYARMVQAITGNLGCTVTLEPGRSLVGDAGVLLTRVVYVKQGLHRRFAILDAAMNDLLRPSLYGAYHPILPVVQAPEGAPLEPVDVVGPVCETGDTFARERLLPPLADGDLLVIGQAGAYGSAMASTYNSRPLVPEVMVKGSAFAITRPRPAIEDMLALERMPEWLPG